MKAAIILLLVCIAVAAAVFLGITMFSVIPMVDDEQLELYKQVGEAAGVGFGEMIHLDCVRYENDFEQANPNRTVWEFLSFSTELKKRIPVEGDKGISYKWSTVEKRGFSQKGDLIQYVKRWANVSLGRNSNNAIDGIKAFRNFSGTKFEKAGVSYKISITINIVELYEVAENLKFNQDQMDWLISLNDEMVAYEVYGDGTDVGDLPGSFPTTNYGLVAWPAPSYTRISSPFGWRIHPVKGLRSLHAGIDISSKMGNPVIAAADGKVIQIVRNHAIAGNYIVMQHIKDGKVYFTRYLHLSYIKATLGQTAKVGDVIGAVGSTGRSTGPHLHFEVLDAHKVAMDPMGCF